MMSLSSKDPSLKVKAILSVYVCDSLLFLLCLLYYESVLVIKLAFLDRTITLLSINSAGCSFIHLNLLQRARPIVFILLSFMN